MSSKRKRSNLEDLMVAVLKEKPSLTLQEMVLEIEKKAPGSFTGKTPDKSLYSVVYKREKSRSSQGKNKLFLTCKFRNSVVYSLNPDVKDFS